MQFGLGSDDCDQVACAWARQRRSCRSRAAALRMSLSPDGSSRDNGSSASSRRRLSHVRSSLWIAARHRWENTPRWALDQNQCGENTVRPSSDAMYPSFRGHGQSRLPDTRPHFRTAPYTSIGGWQLDACLSKFPVMMQYVAAI